MGSGNEVKDADVAVLKIISSCMQVRTRLKLILHSSLSIVCRKSNKCSAHDKKPLMDTVSVMEMSNQHNLCIFRHISCTFSITLV